MSYLASQPTLFEAVASMGPLDVKEVVDTYHTWRRTCSIACMNENRGHPCSRKVIRFDLLSRGRRSRRLLRERAAFTRVGVLPVPFERSSEIGTRAAELLRGRTGSS